MRFPPVFSRFITNLKIENYPELYDNEASIEKMMLLAFLSPEEIKELDEELVLLSPEGRAKHIDEIVSKLEDLGGAIVIAKTIGGQRRAEKLFQALSIEDQKKSVEFLQRFMMAFLASFHQSLAVRVHGKKLTSLVVQTKAGNDKAFAKAVQIDKRILFAIPYFMQRFTNAHTEGNRRFTEDVGAHLQRPPYKGTIRHKSLYLAFSLGHTGR